MVLFFLQNVEVRTIKKETSQILRIHLEKMASTKNTIIQSSTRGGRGGLLPYMGYIGMCHCEGYGFQAVYSRIGYINQSVWV